MAMQESLDGRTLSAGVSPNRIVTDYPIAVHLNIIEYVFELID